MSDHTPAPIPEKGRKLLADVSSDQPTLKSPFKSGHWPWTFHISGFPDSSYKPENKVYDPNWNKNSKPLEGASFSREELVNSKGFDIEKCVTEHLVKGGTVITPEGTELRFVNGRMEIKQK